MPGGIFCALWSILGNTIDAIEKFQHAFQSFGPEYELVLQEIAHLLSKPNIHPLPAIRPTVPASLLPYSPTPPVRPSIHPLILSHFPSSNLRTRTFTGGSSPLTAWKAYALTVEGIGYRYRYRYWSGFIGTKRNGAGGNSSYLTWEGGKGSEWMGSRGGLMR